MHRTSRRSFRLFAGLCSLGIAALGIGACKGAGSKGTTEKPVVAQPRTLAAPSGPSLIDTERAPERDLRIELEEVSDSAAATAKDRGAVLVGADIYQALPSYGLELGAGLDAVTKTLADQCAVPTTAITRITGQRAIPQEIAGAIQTFADQASGQKALLVVVYAGHGVVDGEGQLQLFTHYTDRAGSGFSQTLPRSEMLRWLQSARTRAKARGTELETILIVDACRTPTQDAPKTARLVRNETWEVYSTSDGELADAPRGGKPSPFLDALCSGVGALASQGDSDLRKTFAEVRRRMADAGAKQKPQLLEPRDDGGPSLVLPGRIRIGFEVFDRLANTRLELGDGDLRADDQPLPRSNEQWILETAPGRTVDLRVKLAGYLPFAQRTTFGKQQNGKVYRVPLLPGLTRVTGRITPAVAVSVTATFTDTKAVVRAGFHRTRAFTRTGESAFELRLPPLAEGSKLDVQIEQSGRILKTVSVEASALVDDTELNGARRTDLGTLELPDADRSGLPSNIDPEQIRNILANLQNDDLGATLPPLFANPDSNAPPSLTPFQRIEWDNATRALTRGDLIGARTHMQTIADGNRSQVDPVVQGWLGHLQLRLALAASTDTEVQAQIDAAEAAQPGSDLVMALRSILTRRMLRRADQMASKADPATIALLKEAAHAEPDGESLYAATERQRIRERRWAIGSKLFDGIDDDARHIEALTNLFGDDPEPWNDPEWFASMLRHSALPLEQRLRQALQVGIATGVWTDADELLGLRRRAIPTEVPSRLAEVEAEIERQRVPLMVRQRVEAAKAAEAADQLDEALQLYMQAREGANPFWREQIDSAEQPLRLRIYEKHSQLGATALHANKPGEALDAFLRASAASGRLHSSVRPLLRSNPELASAADTIARIAALDAQQLAVARETRARQAWQDYVADHPEGVGAAESRDMLRRLSDPWQSTPATPAALARYGAAMVYDEAREVIVLFGGASAGADGKPAYSNDTWLYDGKTWRLAQPANPPSPRAHHAMVYDPARRVTLLFGGSITEGATGMDDTYVWDGERWSPANVAPRPAPRSKHALAFDAERRVVVLYGDPEQRDTWEWDGSRWAMLQAKSYPKYRTTPGLAYSPLDHRVVLFGGSGRDGTAWTWDGKAWTSSKKTGIEAAEGGTLTAAGDRLLFFGGLGRALSNSLLIYDPRVGAAEVAWRKDSTGQPPAPRMHHAAAFDSKRRVLVVHGGMAPPAKRKQPPSVFGDTWEFYVD